MRDAGMFDDDVVGGAADAILLSEHDCFCLAARNPPNLGDATPFIRPTALDGTNAQERNPIVWTS